MWAKEKLGMAMLIVAESVFFFMLLLAFVYFRDVSLKPATESLDIGRTSIYTACLLLSSLVLWRGRAAIAIVFGGIFLVGQGTEYVRMLRSGVTMSHDLFGTTFFTLAGMHGLHVLIGLALLLALRRSVASAMFWQFVVASWVAIFAVVYVWSFA